MTKQINEAAIPSRILYSMFRVSDLERSIAFYRGGLGMRELKRETFKKGRFTLVFMGYGDEGSDAMIELTYNWDTQGDKNGSEYSHGTGYGHVALEVADIYEATVRLKTFGAKVTREPGPMTFAVDETGEREVIAFLEDPDGYKLELIEA